MIIQVTTGMWDFCNDYYESRLTSAEQARAKGNGFLEKLPSPDLRNNGMNEMYYNNFEVLHVPRYLQEDISNFNAAVDESYNIYRHRCD